MPRDVALKVLREGFDAARQTLRFLAECRALARLQHPSIAKVFDAGTAPSGRPWLAMELVDGQPITAWCTERGLGWRERAALVREVCFAIEHAHQKGIVHRDLKPSNVLVTQRDGRAQPVVIDFGVARDLDEGAIGAAEEPELLGTIDYMSPEQAGAHGREIDTRTDVHGLGLLLYELMAGARPFAFAHGEGDAQALLRRIREQEPAPPARLPGALPRLPREIDWIVARALAKNPDARYQNASALAEDLRRLLAGEAVAAGSAGAFYRCRKFARRHWLPLSLSLTLLVTLVAGVLVAARGWAEASAATEAARKAAEQARADQVAAERASRTANRAFDLLDEVWQSADPSRFGRPDYPVHELFADFERNLASRVAGEPDVELRIRVTLGRIRRILGMLDVADRHVARSVELARTTGDPRDLVAPLLEHARTRFDLGEIEAADAAAAEALGVLEAAGIVDAETVGALETLANCRHRLGRSEEALELAERALELRLAGPDGPGLDVARSQLQLANLHGSVGRSDLAMGFVEQAIAALRAASEHHPDIAVALQHLAVLQQRQGDLAAAEASFRESLERRRVLYDDPDHPQVAWAEVDLAWLLHERRRDDEAAALLERALPALRSRLGEQHLYVSEATQRLGAVQIARGRLDEAEALLEQAAARFRSLPGHPVDGLVGCLGNLADVHWRRGARPDARAKLSEALEIARRALPPDHFCVSVTMTSLGLLLAEEGDTAAAIQLIEDALERSSAAGRDGEAALQRRQLERLRGSGQ